MIPNEAANVGSVGDVANMVQVFGICMYFVAPLIIGLLVVYFIRYLNKRAKRREDQRLEKINANKEQKEHNKIEKQKIDKNRHIQTQKQQRINRFFNNKEAMLSRLDDIDEPIVKSDYNNLTLNFDKQGKAIK